MIKFYDELTKKLYDTHEEAEEAAQAFLEEQKVKQSAKEAAGIELEKLYNEIKTCTKTCDEAHVALNKAREAMNKALSSYNKKYGTVPSKYVDYFFFKWLL